MRSPPVAFFGLATRRPVVVTRRPSIGSLRPPDGTVIGAGRLPVPRTRMSALAGRISSWPYGAASLPVSSSRAPRWYVAAPPGMCTTRPAVASPIANRDGVPSRPSSAVTTPVVAHHPSDRGCPDGVERDRRQGGRRGGRRRRQSGSASGVGVAVGAAVGVGVAVGVGATVGVAVASARASDSVSARAPLRARRPGSRGCDSRPCPSRSCPAARAGR